MAKKRSLATKKTKKRTLSKEQREQKAWESKRRPAGHFCLHTRPGDKLVGSCEWDCVASEHWSVRDLPDEMPCPRKEEEFE